MKRISVCLATKWKQPYSRTCGYIKSRIAITLVRDTHRCIWGSRMPLQRIILQCLYWEDVAGLNIFQKACLKPPKHGKNSQNSTQQVLWAKRAQKKKKMWASECSPLNGIDYIGHSKYLGLLAGRVSANLSCLDDIANKPSIIAFIFFQTRNNCYQEPENNQQIVILSQFIIMNPYVNA